MVLRSLALCAFLCLPVMAQGTNPLVGAWERISLMRGTTEGQPPAAPEFLVITADGYYSESELPEGREKVSKPLEQMTKEELVARYSRTAASWGTYTIVGNLLSRRHIMDLNPRAEGSDQARNFHFEGDILVLTAGGPGDTPSGARGGRAGEGPQAGGPPAGGRAGDGPQAGGRAGGGPQGRGGALVVRFKRMKQ